ncbi:unnamed protein product [Closterium sp. Naga37s-1]|nr:unnamed protein product [Closterium sp. Naga37s-1]
MAPLPPTFNVCGSLPLPTILTGAPTFPHSGIPCTRTRFSSQRAHLPGKPARDPLASRVRSSRHSRGILSPPRTRSSCLPARPPLTIPSVLLSPPLTCSSLHTMRAPLSCTSRPPLSSPRVLLSPHLASSPLLTLRAPLSSPHVLLSPHLASSSLLTSRPPLSSPRVLLSPHLASSFQLTARPPFYSHCVLLSSKSPTPPLASLIASFALTPAHTLATAVLPQSPCTPAENPRCTPSISHMYALAPPLLLLSPYAHLTPFRWSFSFLHHFQPEAPLFPLCPSFSAQLHFSPVRLLRSLLLFPSSAPLVPLYSSLPPHSLPSHSTVTLPPCLSPYFLPRIPNVLTPPSSQLPHIGIPTSLFIVSEYSVFKSDIHH